MRTNIEIEDALLSEDNRGTEAEMRAILEAAVWPEDGCVSAPRWRR